MGGSSTLDHPPANNGHISIAEAAAAVVPDLNGIDAGADDATCLIHATFCGRPLIVRCILQTAGLLPLDGPNAAPAKTRRRLPLDLNLRNKLGKSVYDIAHDFSCMHDKSRSRQTGTEVLQILEEVEKANPDVLIE